MDKKENLNKLKSVISNIEKSYGKGSIMMLGKKDIDANIVEIRSKLIQFCLPWNGHVIDNLQKHGL